MPGWSRGPGALTEFLDEAQHDAADVDLAGDPQGDVAAQVGDMDAQLPRPVGVAAVRHADPVQRHGRGLLRRTERDGDQQRQRDGPGCARSAPRGRAGGAVGRDRGRAAAAAAPEGPPREEQRGRAEREAEGARRGREEREEEEEEGDNN